MVVETNKRVRIPKPGPGPDQARAGHIVIVISSLAGGGAERVVVDLAGYLVAQGRAVTVLTLSGDDPDFYQLPEGVMRARMEIRCPARSVLQSIRFTWNHLASMRRKLKALKPSIVIAFGHQTNVRTIGALLGTSIPVIVAERTHPAYARIGRAWDLGRAWLYPLARVVVAQSTHVATWFQQKTRVRRLVIIPNATRTSPDFAPVSSLRAERRIVAVGRLSLEKGFDLLLQAFAQSCLADEGWRLAILGEGPERDQLLEQARALNIGSKLDLPGHVSDISGWITASEIFALSSRYDGFPNALIEAMQLGRACVSFDCPGAVADLIIDDLNGRLVPAENVNALANALRQLAENEPLRQRLGEQARNVVIRFSPAEIYEAWLKLADEIAVNQAMVPPASEDLAH